MMNVPFSFLVRAAVAFVVVVVIVQAPWGLVVLGDRDTFQATTAPTACMDSFGLVHDRTHATRISAL
jgi:hypothetical protein